MECDGCTLCCKYLPVPWMSSPAGEYCIECEPGVGCKIEATKPAECAAFACMYNQMPVCSPDLRPDRCGVIFEKISDVLVFGTAITNTSSALLAQLASFEKQGYSVVLDHFNERRLSIFTATDRTAEEVFQEFRTWQLQLIRLT